MVVLYTALQQHWASRLPRHGHACRQVLQASEATQCGRSQVVLAMVPPSLHCSFASQAPGDVEGIGEPRLVRFLAAQTMLSVRFWAQLNMERRRRNISGFATCAPSAARLRV